MTLFRFTIASIALAILTTATTARAGVFIGTYVGNDSAASVTANLGTAVTKLGKLDNFGGSGVGYESGFTVQGGINYFAATSSMIAPSGSITLSLGAPAVSKTFAPIGSISGSFGTGTGVKFAAFNLGGPSPFTHYAVKAGNQYSLWKYISGNNIAYTDQDNNVITTPWLGTGGALNGSNGIKAISHITFYNDGSGTNQVMSPEPVSMVGFAALTVAGLGAAVRRKRAK
jgi:hypothetical protein